MALLIVLVLAVGVVIVGTILAVDHVKRLPPKNHGLEAKLFAIKEKRRIYERDRAEWRGCLSSSSTARGATLAMERIDQKLLDLAEEEANLMAHLGRKTAPEEPETEKETRT